MKPLINFSVIAALLSLLTSSFNGYGQNPEAVNIEGLKKIINTNDNRLYVVNLWATWCPPCVKELPAFEKTAGQFSTTKVKFILISLDFPSEIEKKLIPFLFNNKITQEVKYMTDTDYNSWIDIVDPSWQGNIPVTLFFNNAKKIRHFHSGELSEKELADIINKLLIS